MNKTFLGLVLVALPILGVAQQTATISGRIIAQQSAEAIEYGTISIFQAKDSTLVAGTISNEKGQFSIEVPRDSLYLQAQFLGFENYFSEVFYATDRSKFGDIPLRINSSTLSEVEVTGRAITSSHKVDKQVFDAEDLDKV